MKKIICLIAVAVFAGAAFSSQISEERKRQILLEEWHGAMKPLVHPAQPITTARDFTAVQAVPAAPEKAVSPAAARKLQEKIVLKGSATLGKAVSEIATTLGMTAVADRGIDLEQHIRLNFDGVPAANALSQLLSPLGYAYKMEADQLRIVATITRSFRVVMPPIRGEYDASTTNVHHAAAGSETGGMAIGTNISVATQVRNLDIWEDLDNNIRDMLSDKGKYRVNKAAGLISITDYVPVVKDVERYITFVNSEISKQVLLKAKIVEVGLARERSLGINWDMVRERFTLKTEFPFTRTPGTPAVFTLPYGLGDIGTEGMSAVIEALETQGNVNVLSQPQVLVLNNQPAAIQVGDVTTYVERLSKTISETSETFSVETGSFQSGITMSMVARIVDPNNIYLNIVPVISNLLSLERAEFAEGNFVHLPQTNSRSMNSIVKVSSGETIVIGGLILQKNEDVRQGIPVLRSMPILGKLFGTTETRRAASEIVIFVTPVVGGPM